MHIPNRLSIAKNNNAFSLAPTLVPIHIRKPPMSSRMTNIKAAAIRRLAKRHGKRVTKAFIKTLDQYVSEKVELACSAHNNKKKTLTASLAPTILSHPKHQVKLLNRFNRNRAIPIAKLPQGHKEIKGLTEVNHERLQKLTHQVAFFANRLSKHLIAGSLDIYKGKPNRQTDHSPAKDLDYLVDHITELLDVYEDTLYQADLSDKQ